MPFDFSYISTTLGDQQWTSSCGQLPVPEIGVYTVKITFLLRKPARGRVIQTCSVQLPADSVHSVRIELSPALVEDGIDHDTGMIIQVLQRILHMLDEDHAPLRPAWPVIRPFLKAKIRQRRIQNPAVTTVLHHILNHEHTFPVAGIVEYFRFNLNMLAQAVEAQTLHAADISAVLRWFLRQVVPIQKIPLIQNTVQEDRLTIQKKHRLSILHSGINRTQSKVALHLICRCLQCQRIQIGMLRRPVMQRKTGILHANPESLSHHGDIRIFAARRFQTGAPFPHVKEPSDRNRQLFAVRCRKNLYLIQRRGNSKLLNPPLTGYRFDPYRLPDAGHRRIPHTMRSPMLLAVGIGMA